MPIGSTEGGYEPPKVGAAQDLVPRPVWDGDDRRWLTPEELADPSNKLYEDVLGFHKAGDLDKIINIDQSPIGRTPRSNPATYTKCFDIIRELVPSARGELEVTDITRWYLERGKLRCTVLQNEWIDAGTFESLHRAAELVRQKKKQSVEQAKEQVLSGMQVMERV